MNSPCFYNNAPFTIPNGQFFISFPSHEVYTSSEESKQDCEDQDVNFEEREESLADKLNYIFNEFPDNSDFEDWSDDEPLDELDMKKVKRHIYN